MIVSGTKHYKRNKYSAWQRVNEPGTMSPNLRVVREDLPEEVRSKIRSKDMMTKPDKT